MSQLAFALRVNESAEHLGMSSHDSLGTVSALRRARTSGRFQRTKVANWRARESVPVRTGRPPAVTPELAEVALALLRQGVSVDAMCARVGVAKSSWYRWVHSQAQGEVQVRRYRRKVRHPHSVSADLERQMVALDKQGLARVHIAERLGLHVNTVVKYLLRSGRPSPRPAPLRRNDQR